jgi:hypothetical protein
MSISAAMSDATSSVSASISASSPRAISEIAGSWTWRDTLPRLVRPVTAVAHRGPIDVTRDTFPGRTFWRREYGRTATRRQA